MKHRSSVARLLLPPLLSVVLGATVAPAQTSITHAGSTEPSTEGWRPYDVVAGVNFNYAQRPGIGPVNDNGTPAWKVEDLASDPSTNSIYEYRFASNSGLLSGAYWRFSACVKALPAGPDPTTDNSASNCSFGVYTHTSNSGTIAFGYAYGAQLYQNAAGTTVFNMSGNSNGVPGSINTILPGGFNWVELLHDPTTQRISLYINGTLVSANAPYSYGAGGNYGGNIIDWGDLIQTNGGYGGGEWNTVDFAYSPTPLAPLVPEPSTVALALSGALALGGLAVRRQRIG